MGMGDICNCLNVNQVGIRIAQRLKENRLGIFINCLLEVGNVIRVNESSCNAVLRQGVGKVIIGTAVNGLGCYNVVTVLCQRLEGIAQGCCTGCHCQSGGTAFQRRDTLFKNILGGVGQSAVDIACICKAKTCLCMIAVMEHIGSGLVNRNRSCVGGRVSLLLSYMKLQGFKMEILLTHNYYTPFFER